MLTLPDFKQKQILFIKADRDSENKIRFHNDNIIYEKNDKVENRASCYKVFAIFIIGYISITSELIRKGVEHGLSFFFFKENLDCYASINSMANGHYLLRKKQYLLDKDAELIVSRSIVLNKIINQIQLLKSRGKNLDINFEALKEEIQKSKNLETLRGIEGNISKEFFCKYFEEIDWYARMPRVKPDPQNFLLDIGYTFLFNFIDALLNLFGFDTYKGIYHQLFFQRKSLTCDVIEPFRCIIDREVLKIFTLKIFNKHDFKVRDGKVTVDYKQSHKYALRFFNAILENKESIYTFIRDFYHFIMDSEKYEFPYFKI